MNLKMKFAIDGEAAMDCGRMLVRTSAWAGWLAIVGSALTMHSSVYAQDKAVAAKPADLKLETTGLALAPSQSAFFSSTLNLRETCLREVETGFIGQLRQTNYGQRLEAYLQEKWDNPEPQTEQVKRVLSGAIARDIIQLLSDMSAKECFIIGDKSWSQFLQAFSKVQYDMADLNGQGPEAVREHFLGLDRAYFDAIPIPTTVIGFQLSDDGNARTQLDALEGILRVAMSNVDQLKAFAKNLKRDDLPNGQTLSMSFLADDIPWEAIPIPNDEAQDLVDHLSEMIAGRKIVLTFGVLDNRLLMSISEKTDTLVSLGKGGNKLLASEAIAQLMSNQPANLRTINFTSGEFRSAALQTRLGNYFERMALQITAALETQFESDEFDQWREKLLDDCEWLDDKMLEALPKYQAMLAYSFDTTEGTESYAYDWTEAGMLENAKPLAVTSHAGTSPLMLMALRQRWLKGVGEIIDATLGELPKHVEALAESGMLEEHQVEELESVTEKLIPILEDIFVGMRDKVMAGMDGNESVTALTAQAQATQLSDDMPPPPAALPLPELSVAVKIKNRDLFLSGCDEVVQGINALIDLIRQKSPGGLPPGVQVPAAREDSLADGGTRYYFPMGVPAPWDQFEIQMAINNDVAVLGYSTRQVKDMYQSRNLSARPAWYSAEDPTAAVGFIDFAGIFKAIKPWIHYGLVADNRDMEEPFDASGDVPTPSGNDILKMWDCLDKLGKSAGTTVVDKKGVTVSHWIWVGGE